MPQGRCHSRKKALLVFIFSLMLTQRRMFCAFLLHARNCNFCGSFYV